MCIPVWIYMLVALLSLGDRFVVGENRKVLVFGGNGFIGAATVARLLGEQDKVTIVSRGNWYWDSEERIKAKVEQAFECDRKKTIATCPELVEFIESTEHFDAVLDFSAQTGADVKDASKALHGKVGLYVLISTGSIYDVCDKKHHGVTKETDAVRPESMDEQQMLRYHHMEGHNKLEAEEELLRQRQEDSGFPFVILRMPDVIGPRDTTYRFWIYQTWVKLGPHLKDFPAMLPAFLKDYEISFAYSEDVAKTILEILTMGPQIRDQALNLAYQDTATMGQLLEDIQEALGVKVGENLGYWPGNYQENFYLYPTIRRGPVDVTKAESLLGWTPTPWKEAIKATVEFYEQAMRDEKYSIQRDEIIQIVGAQIYLNDTNKFYDTLEKVYDIKLHHFRPVKDEL